MSRKWSVMEKSLHINLLELSVVENAIQRQRQIQTDLIVDRQFNSLLHQSPGRKKICSHVRHGWFYTDVTFGVYSFEKLTVLGKNVIANQLSRGRQIPKMTELSLNQDVVQQLFRVYSTPNIDLFATRKTKTISPLFSIPRSSSMEMRWSSCRGMFAYAIPLPILFPKIHKTVDQKHCVLLLISEFSPRQS